MPSLRDFQDLTAPQATLLERLERSPEFTERFYFTGGTLLKALGIVPRESNDLDFFTFPHVDERTYMATLGVVLSLLREMFGEENIVTTERGFLVKGSGMVVECVYDAVRNIDNFVSFGNLQTPGLKDFAANKAAAFCVRDEVKDCVDIAFLTKREGWLLADLADMAEERFSLGTISEKKLLTELLHKRETLTLSPLMFLRNQERNLALVEEQVQFLLDHVTL